MTAEFELEGLHRLVLVIKPADVRDRLMLAAWIQYDANAFRVHVDRFDNGQIEKLTVIASEAS